MKTRSITHSEGSLPFSLFRVLFGLLMLIETWGAVAIGWVQKVYVEPDFLFTFIGFEWLNGLPQWFFPVWFILLGTTFIFFAFAPRKRWLDAVVLLGWCVTYFAHKSSYNNHHYLYLLILLYFLLAPNISSLFQRRSSSARHELPRLWRLGFILLFGIVYFYAAKAKIYPDWLSAKVTKMWIGPKAHLPFLDWFYGSNWAPYFIAYGGILYDFFVIPALAYRPTRKWALAISIFFHITNSITFEIGTFPYVMIAASVLFFNEEELTSTRLFKRFKPDTEIPLGMAPKTPRWIPIALAVFFVFQIILPLRHHLYPDTVYWTEEGHRLSWRMMLRSKSGLASFRVVKPNGESLIDYPSKILSSNQVRMLPGHPDYIWQYVQYLKLVHGPDIEVYGHVRCSLNGRERNPMVDPNVNLAQVKWQRFTHSDWIVPFAGWIEE